jgi:hypothetical protein
MAFKVFAPGVLTSSDVNTFLMRQAVITCTSTTRPASPNEGMTIYETNTDLYRVYDGANWIDAGISMAPAWTTYTPTISGSGWALGNGIIQGRFSRYGLKGVHLNISIAWGSTSTFGGSGLELSFPSGLSPQNDSYTFQGQSADVSVANRYVMFGLIAGSPATIRPYAVQSSAGLIQEILNTRPFTWESGDTLWINGTYRAA